jgi:Ca2+-binding RTX toxin-like protein
MATYVSTNSYSVFQLKSAGVASVLFSHDGTLIYAARRDGIIDVYDVATRAVVSSWTVGAALGGMSLSDDGSFLMVTEDYSAPGVDFNKLHRVSTATGAVQTYVTDTPVSDVEIVNPLTALVAGQFMQRLNLVTGEFSSVPGVTNFSGTGFVLTENGDVTLIGEPGVSDGPQYLYDNFTGIVTATGNPPGGSGFNRGHQAVSLAAGQVAQYNFGNDVFLYDLDLNYIGSLTTGGVVDGLAYDASGQFLFAYLIETNRVAKYRVSDGSLVESYAVAGSQWHNNVGAGDQLKFSVDGFYMTVADTYALNGEVGTGGRLQLIDFTARNETFNGTAGADSFTGLDGNDIYIVNNAGDVVIESPTGGIDKVISSVTHTLAAGVENLTLATGTAALSGTGNGLNNKLVGNAGNNTLRGQAGNDEIDGGAGNDSLYGGTGDDVFIVEGQGDIVFENASEGYDLVVASAGYYLWGNLEALVLASGTGSDDFFGVGNGLDNSITGNSGSNLLIGGGGNDAIYGLDGIDALFGEAGSDSLFGGAGIDYLVGGAGSDVLDGGDDPDALYGEDGVDLLRGGSGFVTDILVGGAGADTLDGASGLGDYDLMDGGADNDVYIVDTPNDLTFEAIDGGTDTVRANIVGAGYYLYPFTENLVLEGITPFGVGNELNNVLTGNSIGNYLLGGLGNDTLNGKGGGDVLFGEGGADTFVFERGTGGDVIGDFAPGADKIRLVGLGVTNFAQVQALFVQNGGNTGIILGQGDLIVLNGVTNAQLSATDFIFG